MPHSISVEDCTLQVLNAGTLSLRDVDGGEEPFLYSSGNKGPGYVLIKALVGWRMLFRMLISQLALKLADCAPQIEFVVGNATGGMIPGWLLSDELEKLYKRPIPFVYARNMRKKGGHKDLITGIDNNPYIKMGANGLIVEELVNFAQTTSNSTAEIRRLGYTVTHAACILSYENPVALREMESQHVSLVSLFTLKDLLDTAEKHKTHPPKLVASYRMFLENPLKWQQDRGFEPDKEGGTQ